MAEKKTYHDLGTAITGCPAVGSRWAHYKGNDTIYHVVGAAIAEATQQPLVLYRPESSYGVVFARPLTEWEQEVEHEGKKVRRFTPVE